MGTLRARIAGAVIAATVAALAAVSARAVTWDMPTPYPDNNFHTLNIKAFADEVRAATKGEVDIRVHANGSLIKHEDIKNAVRGGQVRIGEILLSRMANENAVFEVDSVPFLATDYEQSKKLWAAARGTVETLLEAQGLTVLYTVPWPPQGIFAKKPINTVDDMKGVKFRAYNRATTKLAELAGAVPTQVEVPDIAQAFATGRVEAMITSPSTGANAKAWDFVSHFYHTQAWLPRNAIIVNAREIQKLAAPVREAVLKAAAAAEARGVEASRKETTEQMAVLAKNGMTVADPSPTLKTGLAKIGEAMTADWVERAGDPGKRILDAYRQ
jgi:TRAP-type C4-dicarboxylate transport system substrate-binding protein